MTHLFDEYFHVLVTEEIVKNQVASHFGRNGIRAVKLEGDRFLFEGLQLTLDHGTLDAENGQSWTAFRRPAPLVGRPSGQTLLHGRSGAGSSGGIRHFRGGFAARVRGADFAWNTIRS